MGSQKIIRKTDPKNLTNPITPRADRRGDKTPLIGYNNSPKVSG
jgi:hypothetical protein